MYLRGDSGTRKCTGAATRPRQPAHGKSVFVVVAAGENFKKGEKLPKRSYWDSVIIKILTCPSHGRESRACSCQYHPSVSLIVPV